MNFVTLKLSTGRRSGDIRPLVLQYTYAGATPMIPLRLTSVAATPDMGVLVWVLAGARAVPLNYPHVEVDYAQVNWYASQNAAYASFQQLVTRAMDEAGGHGFVTEMAGRVLDVIDRLPRARWMSAEYEALTSIVDTTAYFNSLVNARELPREMVLGIIQESLPPNLDMPADTYASGADLERVFGRAKLIGVRPDVHAKLLQRVVDPADVVKQMFRDRPYITRLYTTLSPEDMTLDPVFSYNEDLADQPIEREATLEQNCIAGDTHWVLRLGPGTRRDGEVVAQGVGDPGFIRPVFDAPALLSQKMLTTRITSGSINLSAVELPRRAARTDPPVCGSGLPVFLLLSVSGLVGMCARRT